MIRLALVRAALVITAVALGACTTSASPSTALPSAAASSAASAAASAGEGAAVEATLTEFEVTLSPDTAPAGTVTFNVTNNGTQTHEFVVIKTDTPADELPVEDSTVSEDGVEVVDEIEDLEAGATETLDVDLDAGHYVIICNVPGHYSSGMHMDFTVE